MYANVLIKPLRGSQFRYERECLTGWAVQEGAGVRAVVHTVRFDLSGAESAKAKQKGK